MASNDVTIKGIPIEKDTAVIISIINRHMDPEIWPEPEKYDPDRWVEFYRKVITFMRICMYGLKLAIHLLIYRQVLIYKFILNPY